MGDSEQFDIRRHSLVNIIDEQMEATTGYEYFYPKRSLWGTDGTVTQEVAPGVERTFGSCPRAVVMDMLGIGPGWVVNARSQKSFDLGHDYENRMQGYLNKAGVLKVSNQKFYLKKRRISGEFDGILEIEGHPILWECKSGSGYFKKKKILSDREISDNYILQVGLYLWVGREIFKNGAILLYGVFSDKGINYEEFIIDYDEDWNIYVGGARTRFNVLELLDSFEVLNAFHDNEIIPARTYYETYPPEYKQDLIDAGVLVANKHGTYSKGDWNCGYCSKCEICEKMGPYAMSLEEYKELFPEKPEE